VARNRKRAKERRARRPQGASVAAPPRSDPEATPDPIEHAAPDVELADAQLAVGRPDLSEAPDEELRAEAEDEPEARGGQAEELEDDELELQHDVEDEALAHVQADGIGERAPSGQELAAPGAHAPERHAPTGNRLINFLRGSWRELQRVQWPDRRQVMQATGVVIGFVIVAGVFLGVADFLAGKLMNYILK
jgi:preprotein translocase subunit SecE